MISRACQELSSSPFRQIQSGIQPDNPCVWIQVRLLFNHKNSCIYPTQLIDGCCDEVMWRCLVSADGCELSCFSEGKCLRDEEVLQTLPVGTTASFYFSDLGPQLTWGTVSPHTHRHTMFTMVLHGDSLADQQGKRLALWKWSAK